jgi:signal peptidase I
MGRARTIGQVAVQFVAVVYLTLVVSLLFWSHAPQLIGWQPRVVLTGSMLPVIQPGDVSVIGPAVPGPVTLPKGRVVLVRDESMTSGFYLHRVVRYDVSGRLVTKGDANSTPDTQHVAPDAVRGQLRLVVPLVGRPVVWLQNGDYLPIVLVVGATWATLVVVLGGRRPGGGQGPTGQVLEAPQIVY